MNAIASRGHPVLGVAQRILEICSARAETAAVTPMQLLKLVYLCHGWTLGLLGRPLIREEVQAWRYGPVVRELYDKIRQFGSAQVTCVDGATPVSFERDEESIVNQVCAHYGAWSGMDLSRLTHRDGSPWEITYRTQGQNAPISSDLIEDYYRRLHVQAAADRSAA